MSQQRCATCRFFVPGSSPTTGQCGHPARQAVFGLVMVRAQELACRRGMDASDWEAVGQGEAVAPATVVEPVALMAPVVPTAELETRASAEPALAESSPAEPPRQGTRQPATSADPVGRRRGFQGAPTPVAADAPVTPRRELNTDGIPIVRQRPGVVAEAHRNAQRRRRQAEARRIEQSARLGEVLTSEPTASVPDNDATDQHHAAFGQVSSSESEAATAEQQSITAPSADGEQEALATARRRLPAYTIDHRWETPDDLEAMDTSGATVDPARAPAVMVPRNQPLPVATSEVKGDLSEWENEWLDLRRAEHDQKCCGTCRDFRASDTPERGWCGNAFAHSHRQLVTRDDLACLSVLGVWWVASDDTWLAKAGSARTGPTPLADELYDYLTRRRHRPRA